MTLNVLWEMLLLAVSVAFPAIWFVLAVLVVLVLPAALTAAVRERRAGERR